MCIKQSCLSILESYKVSMWCKSLYFKQYGTSVYLHLSKLRNECKTQCFITVGFLADFMCAKFCKQRYNWYYLHGFGAIILPIIYLFQGQSHIVYDEAWMIKLDDPSWFASKLEGNSCFGIFFLKKHSQTFAFCVCAKPQKFHIM